MSAGKILNYNPAMEYRPLGRSGVSLSVVSLGGHWKRIGEAALGRPFHGAGYDQEDFNNIHCEDFLQNRDAVVSRAIELGVNYIDACAGPEILAYAKVLKGRRDRMYLGYSWHTRESRYEDYQTAASLLRGLDEGMREAGLDYVDLWRISLPMDGVSDPDHLRAVEEGAIEALETARSQGKIRFSGVSTHNKDWMHQVIERHAAVLDTVLFPCPAGIRVREKGSLLESAARHGVGIIGIKPFADSALFKGDSSPSHPCAAADDHRARLAIRSVLSHPEITATLPGCASVHHLENAVRAAGETKVLTVLETEELSAACAYLWTRLSRHQRFLEAWRTV